MTAVSDGVELRDLHSVADFKAAEQLQFDVWGSNDLPDNADILLAIGREGGLVAGAWRDDRLLGFVFGFPTSEATVQHSHRLAVHPDARGLGLGSRLKWYQRDWCLARGITQVRWTYDPLRAINARLNIAHLGAVARVYHEDYYGAMAGINAGVPSDRLVAEWHLDTAPVIARASNPQSTCPLPSGACETVPIPANFAGMLDNDVPGAIRERLRVRKALQDAFARGLQITGFDSASHSYYLQPR